MLLSVAIAVMLLFGSVGLHPLWPSLNLTTAEAALLGHDAAFVRKVIAGADPTIPATVRPGMLDGTEQVITPLEAAVLSREQRTLKTVLKFGGAPTGEAARKAVCAAHQRAPHLLPLLYASGATEIAAVLCDSHGT